MFSIECESGLEDAWDEIVRSLGRVPVYWKALVREPISVLVIAATNERMHGMNMPSPELWSKGVWRVGSHFSGHVFDFELCDHLCAFPLYVYYAEQKRMIFVPIQYSKGDDEDAPLDWRRFNVEQMGESFQSAVVSIAIRDNSPKLLRLCHEAFKGVYPFDGYKVGEVNSNVWREVPSDHAVIAAACEAIPPIWRGEHLRRSTILVIGKTGTTSDDWRRGIPSAVRLERVLERHTNG